MFRKRHIWFAAVRAKYLTKGLSVAVFGLAGAYLLFSVHAATVAGSTEAEAGVLSGGASQFIDSTASGQQAVRFGNQFVTASGTNLNLNGKSFQYIGFDTGMAGACWSVNWTTAQMDTYFSNLPANGMTRVFAVQPVGTSFVSTVVTEAAKYNQHLILVLGDDDSYCNDTDGAPAGKGSGKTTAFYQAGWQGQYLTWLNTIVPMFKDNPTVAVWEIANEPFHAGATYSQLGLSTMEAYLNGAAAAIRADDPNHLIAVGSANIGDYGSASNYTAAQSDSNIDILDFHDYAWDYENGITISGNFAAEKAAAGQLNKPYMIDEAGVEAGSCTSSTPASGASGHGVTYPDRVTYLTNKASYYLSNGASGVDFWDYELTGNTCTYEVIPPNDPLIAAVKNYTLPN